MVEKPRKEENSFKAKLMLNKFQRDMEKSVEGKESEKWAKWKETRNKKFRVRGRKKKEIDSIFILFLFRFSVPVYLSITDRRNLLQEREEKKRVEDELSDSFFPFFPLFKCFKHWLQILVHLLLFSLCSFFPECDSCHFGILPERNHFEW